MSYGVFNWWWGEKDNSEWGWLIAHLNKIVQDVRPDPYSVSGNQTLDMRHIFTTPDQYATYSIDIGWLDFRFLAFSQKDKFNIHSSWRVSDNAFLKFFDYNIRIPTSEGIGEVSPETIVAFVKLLKTHPKFYNEVILKGEPFVWIPKTLMKQSGKTPKSIWWGDSDDDKLWHQIDGLFADIREGYICINPEANRIIAQFLSDNYKAEFQEVANASDWRYLERKGGLK